jgi:hypothetical protein
MGKQVAICRDCIYKYQSDKQLYASSKVMTYKNCLLEIDKMPYCLIEETEAIDFVTGETKTAIVCCISCREKNKDGNCPDYKQTHAARIAAAAVPVW